MAHEFHPGETVTIRTGDPTGHCRTPFYLRGKPGIVVRQFGRFRNPEELAYGKSGEPKLALYHVRFEQGDLWPDYPGSRRDTLFAEIYEHWLEPRQGEGKT